jgi:hypothetical protein
VILVQFLVMHSPEILVSLYACPVNYTKTAGKKRAEALTGIIRSPARLDNLISG